MKHPIENFRTFAGAFFNTANEKGLRLTAGQKHRAVYGLSLLHHLYDTDRFHQIRHGEELALGLQRKVGRHG